MSAASGLIKVTKRGAKAAPKAPPFYSAVDNAVDNLPNKATPEQMIKELLKQKEVKAQELIDRGIDKKLGVPIVQKERTVKLKKPDAKGNTEKVEKYFEVTPGEKGAKAITKDEVINTVEQNPPKQITEDIMGDITPEMIDQQIEDMIHKEVINELGPRPRLGYEREDWLEDYDRLVEQKSQYSDDYYEAAKNSIKEEGGFKAYKYDEYKLPGGENYREILLKLPTFDPRKERQLMELEANLRRMNPADFPPGYLDSMQEQAAKLKAEKEAIGGEFRTPHWDQPNVLAHIRVQDRVGPNGEKVLHVEEIQSDWHQAGRKKGYRKPDQPERLKGEPYQLDDGTYGVRWEDGSVADLGWGKDHAERLAAQGKLTEGVPDAPFKKNWHELAMKRLINYASENGYDKIAITPGAQQAKRYDLSKQVDSISWEKDADGKITFTPEKDGASLTAPQTVDPQELSSHLGKDVAEKILKSQEDGGFLEGLDLKVGGKGMVGFYDQILPAYLNKYGEKYGAKVGQLPISSGEKMIPDNAGLGMIRSGEPELTQLHSFDITPQMREEVLTKGQPLYQQIGIPAATGAAGAEMLGAEMPEEPGFAGGGAVNENTVPDMSDGGQILQGPPFKRGGKVSITNNPDAMFLELNDQRFGVGGAAKKAVKALKAVKGTQEILPAAEREANLAKMLEPSAVKKRLYHGGNKDYSAFSLKKQYTGEGGSHSGSGFYLTDSPESASNYAIGRGIEGANVKPVYASLKNPLEFDWSQGEATGAKINLTPKQVRQIISSAPNIRNADESPLLNWGDFRREGFDKALNNAVNSYANSSMLAALRNDFFQGDNEAWLKALSQATGHDSATTVTPSGERHYIAWSPEQIKSATGNRGTYDITSPDINEAQGGLATLKRK